MALLMGQAPPEVSLNPMAQIFTGAVLGIAGLELLAVARGARTLRRWRTAPPQRAGVRHIILPLAGNLLAALLFLGLAPMLLGGSLAVALYLVPDLGYTLATAGVMALGWGLLRTGLALRLAPLSLARETK